MKSALLRNCNSTQELTDDTINNNICIYSGCNLKCINGFNFCYQHISKRKPKIKDLKTTLVSKIETNETKANCISNTKVKFDLSDSSDDEELSKQDKPNTIESNLNHASVYTRDEIMKVFKTKLHRLKYLYKQQLLILNDKLIIDHKRDLLRKKYSCVTSDTTTTRRFNRNTLKTHLNQRFNPLFKESKKSFFNQEQSANLCSFLITCANEENATIKCKNKTIPMSNYCIDHILNDENQVLFSECNHTSNGNDLTSNSKLKHAIVSSIGQECPLHFKNESTKLDDTLVDYTQMLNRKRLQTTRLNSIRKKYLKKRVELVKKKKLTISEIFSNSNIIIQQDDDPIISTTSPKPLTSNMLASIKDELIDNTDTTS